MIKSILGHDMVTTEHDYKEQATHCNSNLTLGSPEIDHEPVVNCGYIQQIQALKHFGNLGAMTRPCSTEIYLSILILSRSISDHHLRCEVGG